MGYLIAIEANDGAGKETQSKLLVEYLNKIGKKAIRVSFPNYESDSSALVKMYLNGDFGQNASDVSPYIASVLYAVDRYATYKKELEKLYNEGVYIVSDRYVSSNMTHQAQKLTYDDEREKFLDWLKDFEYNILGIPKPNITIYLDVSPEISLRTIEKRNNKIDNSVSKDIHERDKNHIINAYNISKYLIEKENWQKVKCYDGDNYISIDEIHNAIKALLKEKSII